MDMSEGKCALDIREEELRAQGYVKAEPAYWRLGRAIFIIDSQPIEPSAKEALSTPIGVSVVLSGGAEKLVKNAEMMKELQGIFGSTATLRITVEGDPDSHMSGSSTIQLTGYRGGLDDIILDDKLLNTVHGSHEDIIRNFAEWLEWQTGWCTIPRWETYDGVAYGMKGDLKHRKQGKALAARLRRLANELEHADDMPDWVADKFKEKVDS